MGKTQDPDPQHWLQDGYFTRQYFEGIYRSMQK